MENKHPKSFSTFFNKTEKKAAVNEAHTMMLLIIASISLFNNQRDNTPDDAMLVGFSHQKKSLHQHSRVQKKGRTLRLVDATLQG